VNCFNHRTTSAVALCRGCGKGLCPGCANDTGQGVACRDSCETRVIMIGKMLDNTGRATKAANFNLRVFAVSGFITGSVFLGIGALMYLNGQAILALILGAFGLPLTVSSLVHLVRGQHPNPEE
jgi:hypothetical protein